MGSAGSGGGVACVADRRVPVSKRGDGGGLEAGGLGQSTVTQAWHRAGGREGSRKVLGRFTNVVRGHMVHKGSAEIRQFRLVSVVVTTSAAPRLKIRARGTDRVPVQKKYIVRLTDQEREVCQQTVRKLNGSNEKVRRAQILLKADADGQAWTDQQVADALSCRTKTVENIRQRCVLEGFERALERKRRPSPPVPKLLDGEQEAQVIALRLGSPPKGYANWSLRLLARRVVELQIVESVSRETIRRTLKKTG